MTSDEDGEEWKPPETQPKAQRKTTRAPAEGKKKATTKRAAKPKETKVSKVPNAPKVAKDNKRRAQCKPAAEPTTQGTKCLKDSEACISPGMKRKKNEDKELKNAEEKQITDPEKERPVESGPSIRMKEEVRCITIYCTVKFFFF